MSAKQLSLAGVGEGDAATRVGRAAWRAILEQRRAVPEFRMSEEVLIAAIRPALAAELPKARRAGKRDLLFDAVAAGFGCNGHTTRSEAGAISKALKEIIEVDPAVTAEDLTRGCAFVRRKFEKCGPMSLASNWHDISARKTVRTEAAKRDIYQEPAAGWREAAQRRFPDAHDWANSHDWRTINWRDVSTTIRPEIIKALA